jgi:hypothetical protein
VSTAVTIANRAEVIISVFPCRQVAAPAPFLEEIIGRLLPRGEHAVLAVDFEGLSWSQVELLAHLARQGQLAAFGYNRSHACKVL